MVHKIIGIIIMATLLVIGISIYLAPDDLATCDAPSETVGECQAADAIVVISGGDTDARTDGAIQLWKAGWAPYIIFSGAAADKSGPSNAEAMYQRAVSQGVPTGQAVIEGESETTKQNAEQVAAILAERQSRDIILVTSGYHMRRAKLEFSSELGPDTTVRSHPVASDNHWGVLWWATPWGWFMSLSELAKIALFYIGGSR